MLVKNVMLNVVYGETVRYHNSTMGVLGPPGETRFGGPDFSHQDDVEHSDDGFLEHTTYLCRQK